MTIFESKDLKFVLWKNRYGDEPEEKFFAANLDVEFPSPYAALQYYLNDYLQVWRGIESEIEESDPQRRRILTECALLKKFSWVLSDPRWLRDEGFLLACAELRRWFIEKIANGNFPEKKDVINFLRAFKNKNSCRDFE